MHVIVVRQKQGPRRFIFNRRHAGTTAGAALGLALVLGSGGYLLGSLTHGGPVSVDTKTQLASLRAELANKSAALTELETQNQGSINAIAVRMARLDAQVNRLDALGAQIVKLAGLKQSNFNFGTVPGEGGAAPVTELPWRAPDMAAATSALSSHVWIEERELAALEALLLHQKLDSEIIPRGKPFAGGFVSSGYGWRTDPFTGEREFHAGIDLAGRMGDRVHAIAAGVVTWAGPRSGYGKLIIVNDGGGYNTWYAHNEKVLVKVGQIVKRGDSISLLGSTGRSTGPHVHIEVHHDGRPVNPWKYVFGKNDAAS